MQIIPDTHARDCAAQPGHILVTASLFTFQRTLAACASGPPWPYHQVQTRIGNYSLRQCRVKTQIRKKTKNLSCRRCVGVAAKSATLRVSIDFSTKRVKGNAKFFLLFCKVFLTGRLLAHPGASPGPSGQVRYCPACGGCSCGVAGRAGWAVSAVASA